MPQKVDILGVRIDNITLADAKSAVLGFCGTEGFRRVYTPNSEIIMSANRDKKFKEVLNSADLVIPDGIGLVHASRILGSPLKERVAGFDLLSGLLPLIAQRGITMYLFGGKPGIAERAKANIEADCPGIKIVGIHNGYFDSRAEREIIKDINQKAPDILVVCLGSPKQELWTYDHRDELNVKAAICAGGSLDVLAGEVKRAPRIFINLGLEWLCRIVRQPQRMGRAAELPKFALAVIAHRLKTLKG